MRCFLRMRSININFSLSTITAAIFEDVRIGREGCSIGVKLRFRSINCRSRSACFLWRRSLAANDEYRELVHVNDLVDVLLDRWYRDRTPPPICKDVVVVVVVVVEVVVVVVSGTESGNIFGFVFVAIVMANADDAGNNFKDPG